MIQASELRVGNILQYYIGEDGVAWDYTTIDAEDILWCEQRNENFNKVHKPILISHEILDKTSVIKKFNWYEIQKGENYKEGTIIISFRDNNKSIQISVGTGGENTNYIYLPMPKFFHQLQTLIYTLTGEELKITL